MQCAAVITCFGVSMAPPHPCHFLWYLVRSLTIQGNLTIDVAEPLTMRGEIGSITHPFVFSSMSNQEPVDSAASNAAMTIGRTFIPRQICPAACSVDGGSPLNI
uniref:Uncharacterized protein n=1 Tax=Ixodes ricinus TaxID=34613 RepID=A0A6B0UCW8_IXORI